MVLPFPFTLFSSGGAGGGGGEITNTNSLLFDTGQTVGGDNTANANEFCTGGNIFNFDSPDNFSISCWIKWNSTDGGTSQFNFIVTKGLEGTGFRGWQCWVRGNKLYFSATANFSSLYWQYETVDAVIVNDQWHHCVFVFNDSNTEPNIYVDGSEVSISASTGLQGTPGLFATTNSIQTTSDFVVGARDNLLSITTGYKFAGLIDEVSIFNVALDASTVSTIYNGGLPNDISGISGIQSWWRMGDDPSDNITNGGQVTDQVGSNNLTPSSSPSGGGSPSLSTDVPT